MPDNVQYSNYIKELCCDDCDYAGQYNAKGWCPYEPVEICPACGGNLTSHIGRWLYSETEPSFWLQFLMAGAGMPETIYHKFVKGRECESLLTPPPPDPNNNYTLEDSLNAYKAGHK